MLGVRSCEMSFSSTLKGGVHIPTNSRSRKMRIEFANLNSMYRLRLPMCTARRMCGPNSANAQPKDDDLTEHYEFNWCLRSPLGGRLLMQSGTQHHNETAAAPLPPRWGGRTGGGNNPPKGDQTKKMKHVSTTRHPKGTSPEKLHNIAAHPPPPGSCCDDNKNPPPRQLCYVSPRILRHEPCSCYYLRQAPASSLNFAMFR